MTGNGDGARGTDGLKVSLESLETFKKGVDGLLADLEDSVAAPQQMSRDTLRAAHLGKGFAEADSLMSAYSHVHDRLGTLSRVLADQIESMSLLVRGAKDDYQGVDQEHTARLWSMRNSTERHYREAAKDSEHGEHGSSPADTGHSRPGPQEHTAGGAW